MKPTLVMFSPLPPLPNGIADYAAEQVREWSRHRQLVVVIDDAAPEPVLAAAGKVRVVRLNTYLHTPALHALPHVYQVGNNPDHLYLLPILLARPGLVILHDYNLHYLIELATLEQHHAAAYVRCLTRAAGRFGATLGRQFRAYGWKGAAVMEGLPLHDVILDSCRAVVVHSAWSAERLLARNPGMPVHCIPHHLAPSVATINRRQSRALRRPLGLATDAVVITAPGFLHPAKRIPELLTSIAALRGEIPGLQLVLAGMVKPEDYDPQPDIIRLGLTSVVTVTGYLDEPTFLAHLGASDVVVNLRWPIGGETSGTLIRAMGMGCCVVTTAAGPFAEVPDDTVCKIPWSADFQQDLTAALRRLLSEPETRHRLGHAASDWIQSTCDIRTTTAAYLRALDALPPAPQESAPALLVYLEPRAVVARIRAGGLARSCAASLWWREALPPSGGEVRWLVVGEPGPERILHEVFAADPTRIAVLSPTRLADAHAAVDAVLIHVPVATWGADPMALLISALATLRIDGQVILALWEDAAGGCPTAGGPLDPLAWDGSLSAWRGLLEAAGCEILDATDVSRDPLAEAPDLLPATPLVEATVRARRISRMVDRRPAPWYGSNPAEAQLLPLVAS